MHIILWTGVFDYQVLHRAIGAYQIAWWMRKHGYQCQVIDFIHYMSTEELLEYTEKFINKDTICIGASSTFWATDAKKGTSGSNISDKITKVILALRAKYPKLKFVLGGHNADFVSDENYRLFDAAIIGDAEDSFLKLVNDWKDNRPQFHAVTRGGTPFINAVPNSQFNIAELDHRFIDNDCILEGEALPIEISRGCIFKCAFCQYPHIGKTKFDYLRKFELIGEELEYNYSKWKTTNYHIVDDTFNDSDYKMTNWSRIVDQLDFKLNYSSYLRADLLSRNPDHISLLKNSGLFSCHFGIESFHPEASRLVGKGWCGKEAKDFLPKLKAQWQDIIVRATFIIGIPPETKNDIIETLTWLKESQSVDSWRFHCLNISPGQRTMNSDFDRNFEQYGFHYDFDKKQWKTPYFDAKTANEFAEELNLFEPQLKMDNWSAISYLSLGATKQELTTKSRKEIQKNVQHILSRIKFISNYKQKIKNL